jgi:hypothetical protein
VDWVTTALPGATRLQAGAAEARQSIRRKKIPVKVNEYADQARV